MKLFQRLLVAPAALGLLAPMSVIASEVNLNVISNYSDYSDGEIEIDSNSFNNNSIYTLHFPIDKLLFINKYFGLSLRKSR